jgi:hypothetical protein
LLNTNRVFQITGLKKIYLVILFFLTSHLCLQAQPDLYIRDAPTDDGSEPNLTLTPLWISNDIWILPEADESWQPYPFTGSVPWEVPGDANPTYRDFSRFAEPNWVYVKITNRGDQPSTGKEVVRLYWTKASTGLSWKEMWNDYERIPNGCSTTLFMGEEITKPRRNASSLSVDERQEFIAAIEKLNETYYEADSVTWWNKQDQIHQGTHVHGTPNFMPWHREFVNRYENLLRSIDPKLRMPYWDWTTDANNSNGVDLFTSDFMGSDQGRAGEPFNSFDADYDCSIARQGLDYSCLGGIVCSDQPVDFRRPPYIIEREVGSGIPTDIDPDSVIINSTTSAPPGDEFLWLWGGSLVNLNYSVETNHKNAHSYIGKTMECRHTSFEDPFVHLIHSNIDKLWAMWQRNPDNLYRLLPDKMYGNLSSDYYLSEPMHPWDGLAIYSNPIPPWTSGSDDIEVKNAFDPTVVSPPIYDVAGLTIPVLQPNESVVLQMPWYPPNPDNYSCFEGDKTQYSILARIETSNIAPFGMKQEESNDLYENVKNNNNIALKNVTHVASTPGLFTSCVSVYNTDSIEKTIRLDIDLPTDDLGNSLLDYATVQLDLGAELFESWNAGGQSGMNISYEGSNTISLSKNTVG